MRISDWSSDVCSSDLKIRVAVDWNDAGKAAGLPRNLCIKSNWGGQFDNVDIHALEARFYHFLTDKLTAQTATCYYADWNDDGSGQGLVVLEDLIDRGGKLDRKSTRLNSSH